MLADLRVRDLAIIDALDLHFGPGFTALTGETGAGKSIIIDAVGLLLGDRSSQDIVRAGADRAEVEGVFQLDAGSRAQLQAVLEENGLEGDQPDVLVLAREVRNNGRSIARVNGRSVTTSLLSEIGSQLVDIHGQSEHLTLMKEQQHARFLDRYAGLEADREAIATTVRELHNARKELDNLRQDERERTRRIDLLTYQIEEIDSARLRADEEKELAGERSRLANAELLAELTAEVAQLLRGDDGETAGALDALGVAEQALVKLARVDASTAAWAERLGEAAAILDDLSLDVGRYRDDVEFNPQRLQQVEERLHLIHSLERKYGDTIDEILIFRDRANKELHAISNAEERIAELERDIQDQLRTVGKASAALSAARRAAARRMSDAIEVELHDLQMARARFAVDIHWTPDPQGANVEAEEALRAGEVAGVYAFGAEGLDTLAFLVSANPGEPLRPLTRVASGGEMSRLMLALKTVLGRADETPTLIFDEIDQGIGGRVGATVGRKLWGLTIDNGGKDARDETLQAELHHQVLCITHLPQLAAFADLHYHVVKASDEHRTRTAVRALEGKVRIEELARMMGTDTNAGRASASEMLDEVSATKGAWLSTRYPGS